MRGRPRSTEASHDQVMVHLVSRVLECHVLEQMTVRDQDIVSTGANLLSVTVDGPCPVILHSRLIQWEKVSDHVL